MLLIKVLAAFSVFLASSLTRSGPDPSSEAITLDNPLR
jgi:hypothetical protein